MIESIAGTYYRAKEYSKAMQWYQRYFKEGGTSGANRTLLIQTQYLAGDYAGASKELMAEIQAAERSGTTPAEDRINLLMNAAIKQKDIAGETFALERLVSYYPKKEYWVTLLSRIQRKPNFSDRLALDSYRLSLATGSMTAANDFSEMAQLALQAGSGAEAQICLPVAASCFSKFSMRDFSCCRLFICTSCTDNWSFNIFICGLTSFNFSLRDCILASTCSF